MNHIGTKELVTKRLVLRQYKITDAEAIYKNWASNDNVTKYLTWPTHKSIDTTINILNDWVKSYDDLKTYHWGITFKDEDEVFGDIAVVDIDEEIMCAELGWCMSERFWGNGIMPEAAAAVRDYLFDEVGFNRIEARHDFNNPKSGRVMQKIGMQFEGIKRSGGKNIQGIVDVSIYSILNGDRK